MQAREGRIRSEKSSRRYRSILDNSHAHKVNLERNPGGKNSYYNYIRTRVYPWISFIISLYTAFTRVSEEITCGVYTAEFSNM